VHGATVDFHAEFNQGEVHKRLERILRKQLDSIDPDGGDAIHHRATSAAWVGCFVPDTCG
jgi:hypothetical protein